MHIQREGGPVCKEQQVGVCTEGNKTADEVDSHLLLAVFLSPSLSDSVCTESLLFNPWSERARKRDPADG